VKKYLSILIPFLISGCGHSQIKEATNKLELKNAITQKQADLIFEKLKVFPANTQVSIAIIDGGVTKFYGVKREGDAMVAIENQQSVYEIGSISKVFTSTLLADLIVLKKLELNNEINDYLSVPLKDSTRITFKQLANHTSGLPRLPSNLNMMFADPRNPYKDYDEKKLTEYLTNELKLAQKPGEKYAYSNLGAGLLGYIVSKIDNTDYETLVSNKIFSKYQMTSSTTTRSKVESKLVKGLDAVGAECSNWDLAVLTGAGGVLSTAEDLSKFAIAHFDASNKVLELTRTRTHDINENMGIAMAWHLVKGARGIEWPWHNGGTGGYSSSMAIETKNRNAVVILSNVSAFNKDRGNIDNLCFDLMNTLEE